MANEGYFLWASLFGRYSDDGNGWAGLKRKPQILAALVVVGVLGIVVWWLRIETKQGPPKTQEPVGDLTRSSVMVISITASLDDIQRRLNEQIPGTLYAINENRDGCVPAKWAKVCVLPRPWGGCAQWVKTKISPDIDCHVDGAVTRGPIQIGGAANVLNLGMPVSASVTVTGRGQIGKNIRETANGSITAAASVTANVDENWQPSANVNVDYSWNNRIGVDVLGFRITFASKVDPKIERCHRILV